MPQELSDFIAHARGKGMDHATIRMLLLSAGWKEKDVAQALSEESLDMPVPAPPDLGGARDAFFHLLNFAALYTLVIGSIVLFFQYIDRLLPDAALEEFYYMDDRSGIRWAMAAVIVAFPLLLWMSRVIHRDMRSHPEKSWGGVRRWLTYITLFVAAFTLMIDVITLIFSLLEGELSLRFFSKVAVVFVLAGLTFSYYFQALRLPIGDRRFPALNRVFLAVAALITGVALVWGAVIVGSPGTQREHKFDDRRLEDLRAIHNEVRNIVYEGKPYEPGGRPNLPLPVSLEDIRARALYTLPDTVDPETGESYEYRVIDRIHYELCATFTFAREERNDLFWNHPAGRHCITFDVTDTRY